MVLPLQHEIHSFKGTMLQNKQEKGIYLVKRLWSLTVQSFRYAEISFKHERKKRNVWKSSKHDWIISQIF